MTEPTAPAPAPAAPEHTRGLEHSKHKEAEKRPPARTPPVQFKRTGQEFAAVGQSAELLGEEGPSVVQMAEGGYEPAAAMAQSGEVVQFAQDEAAAQQAAGAEGEEKGGTWDWILGILKGDLEKDPSTGQVLVRTVLTMIPGIDQVADVQDLGIAIYQLAWEGRYDEAGPWTNLVLTGIGLVPSAGSLLKGVFKVLLREADIVAALSGLDKLGIEPGKLMAMLDDGLNRLSDLADQGTKHLTRLLGDLVDKVLVVAKVAAVALLGSAAARLRRFAESVRHLSSQMTNKVAEVTARLRERMVKAKNGGTPDGPDNRNKLDDSRKLNKPFTLDEAKKVLNHPSSQHARDHVADSPFASFIKAKQWPNKKQHTVYQRSNDAVEDLLLAMNQYRQQIDALKPGMRGLHELEVIVPERVGYNSLNGAKPDRVKWTKISVAFDRLPDNQLVVLHMSPRDYSKVVTPK